jgi:hypothetical protein
MTISKFKPASTVSCDRSRSCLHGQVAREVFYDAKPTLKAYALRKRKKTFDWVNKLTMTLMQVWTIHTQC